MPVVRYTVSGRFGNRGVTAFTPAPPQTTAIFDTSRAQGTPEDVYGQPGTVRIPAPREGATAIGHEQGHDKLPSGLSESRYMPPSWFPSVYYRAQHLFGGIGGVRIFSDNLMPVPAMDPRGIMPTGGGLGTMAQTGHNLPTRGTSRRAGGLGRLQVTWPKRMPTWGHSGAR